MVDQLADVRSGRRSSRSGGVLITGILCFLLGGALAIWLAWSGALEQLRPATTVSSGQVDAPAVAPSDGMIHAGPPASLENMARQQGGLDQRVAALEQRIARLDMEAAAVDSKTARAEALLVAFAARRAIERGAPLGYLADQLRVRFGDAKPNSVAIVIDAGNHPVTVDKLIGRLAALAPELQDARDEGALSRVKRELSELFIVRHDSAPSPEPRKRLDRAKLFLQSGRVDAAVAEVRNLPGAKKAGDWIRDAERFARAQQALDLLESSALLDSRVLRDGSGQPVL